MADYYIAISRKIKDVMVADGVAAERIFVVHSGVDLKRFAGVSGEHLTTEFNLTPGEKVVINVAHLAGHKGQQFLVRAIPRVVEKFPRVRFFIVGKGELLAELQALAASLGITRELVFTGFRSDVGAFYKIADLFVMSSVQEGLGTAVLDALAEGKAVVATDCGGIPEIIHDGETGRLVEPANPEALAQGIIDVLRHPEPASQMADCGRALVQNQFSIETMAKNNLAVYRMLLSAGKS
jgi:glycosyltransferase involved in cell wall biosynthesis